jgi:thiosulfate/3-mercaptopyruvate sulfurtransferase
MTASPVLISPAELKSVLGRPGNVVLDCTWYLPESQRLGHDRFIEGHIPGAQFFDLEAVRDTSSPLPVMLPTPEAFGAAVSSLGVSAASHVVVVDDRNVSGRLRWMLRYFGHGNVRVLDGGMTAWRALDYPIESGLAAMVPAGDFVARVRPELLAGWHDIVAAIENGGAQVLDARNTESFSGRKAPSYPGIASGHMRGAVNVPYDRFFRPDHSFVSPEEARQVFTDAGVHLDRPTILSCGVGVSAAVLGLMFDRAGLTNWRLYDGSWNEWGRLPDVAHLTVSV